MKRPLMVKRIKTYEGQLLDRQSKVTVQPTRVDAKKVARAIARALQPAHGVQVQSCYTAGAAQSTARVCFKVCREEKE